MNYCIIMGSSYIFASILTKFYQNQTLMSFNTVYHSQSLKAFASFIFLLFATLSFSQADLDAGKTLFRTNCATCHVKNMKADGTGPALAGYDERWSDYPEEDLYSWIRNSQKLIATGHPRANELFNEWKSVMTAMPQLSDPDISNILAYIDGVSAGTYPPKVAGQEGPTEVVSKGIPTWVYWLLFGSLLLFALFLSRIIGNLNQLAAAKEGTHYERKSLFETLTSKGVISFVLFGLVVLGGYTTVNNAVHLGRQQGYAPEQPIKFSHATHAGEHKIECQYCHDGARRSKHAVIPAMNTCMNCHSAIKNGSTYGAAELTKIYASVGYDPNAAGKYIENYDEMSAAEKESFYKKWMTDIYLENEELDELDERGVEEINKQWNDIVSSLTHEQKDDVGGAVEWTRIHNLPDHVYFNHAQHVTVGKIECEQCHGKVEEMEVLQQHAPLSMGWCVNCHRETAVQFSNNDYYKSYEKYHEELASGKRDKVTVKDIGGLECQKCHY